MAEKIKQWAESTYLKGPGPLGIPSLNELRQQARVFRIKIGKKELQKIRDKLEFRSKYQKIGLSGARGRKLYRPSLVPRLGKYLFLLFIQ